MPELDEWWDDSPMFANQVDRMSAELHQLRPWTEWFSFNEMMEILHEFDIKNQALHVL